MGMGLRAGAQPSAPPYRAAQAGCNIVKNRDKRLVVDSIPAPAGIAGRKKRNFRSITQTAGLQLLTLRPHSRSPAKGAQNRPQTACLRPQYRPSGMAERAIRNRKTACFSVSPGLSCPARRPGRPRWSVFPAPREPQCRGAGAAFSMKNIYPSVTARG